MTLSVPIFVIVAAAVLAHFGGILLLLLRSGGRVSASRERPPITVLIPSCGVENGIEETLSSAFTLEYPDYEIVFCVAEHSDPVVPLIRRLMLRHPGVPARLLIGNDDVSINPKLNNLVKGWHSAAHEWVVAADSNVLMPPDYLDRLLERWGPGTGLVSSPPIGIRPRGIGAELECAFLNTHQARWLMIADAFGAAFALGKTMLWRRDWLDRAGGIMALGGEPAEDAAFTKLVRAAGHKVRLVIRPFPQLLGERRLREVWRRQVRWARLRRASFPLVYASEVLSGVLPALTGIAALAGLGIVPPAAYAVLIIAWYGAEMMLARHYGWAASPRIALLLIVRDALLLPLWIMGLTASTFVWRGSPVDIRTVGNLLQRQTPAP